ncbi:hypothetical protein WN51_04267, partial [Melipona quadrifasciata]
QSEFEPQCHVFRTKQLRKPRPCHLCHQAVIKQASCCRVCKYICHKSCEDKVSKQALFKHLSFFNVSAEREAIRSSLVHRFSRISIYTIERRVLGIFATEWIPGEPLPVHEEPLRTRARVPVRASWYSNESAVRREHVQQNSSRTRGDPSVEFSPADISRVDVHACFWSRRNEEEEPLREREIPLGRCILIQARHRWSPMRFSVPRSLGRCYEHTEERLCGTESVCAFLQERIDGDRADSLSV